MYIVGMAIPLFTHCNQQKYTAWGQYYQESGMTICIQIMTFRFSSEYMNTFKPLKLNQIIERIPGLGTCMYYIGTCILSKACSRARKVIGKRLSGRIVMRELDFFS